MRRNRTVKWAWFITNQGAFVCVSFAEKRQTHNWKKKKKFYKRCLEIRGFLHFGNDERARSRRVATVCDSDDDRTSEAAAYRGYRGGTANVEIAERRRRLSVSSVLFRRSPPGFSPEFFSFFLRVHLGPTLLRALWNILHRCAAPVLCPRRYSGKQRRASINRFAIDSSLRHICSA